MYAVIRSGGKQHRVRANDRIVVERLPASPGETVSLNDVLLLAGDGEPVVGAAVPEGARVEAEVLEQRQGRKVLVFKKKRRKNHRRLNGHRQAETLLRITAIHPSADERDPDAVTADSAASGVTPPAAERSAVSAPTDGPTEE